MVRRLRWPPRLRNVGKGGALHGLVDGQFDGDELVNCFVPVVDLLGQLGKGVVLVLDLAAGLANELSLMARPFFRSGQFSEIAVMSVCWTSTVSVSCPAYSNSW